MSEKCTRHRGQVRNAKGKYDSGSPDAELDMIEWAPGPGTRIVQQARDGQEIAGTAYFEPGTDIKPGDELTVRGERYRTFVNEWAGGGFEVLCKRGEG